MRAAEVHGKAVVAGPVFDTIKLVDEGAVRETIDREKLRWPVAWGSREELKPPADPPPAEWFVDAVVVE